MSYIYLRELVEESSDQSFSDTKSCVPSSVIRGAKPSCSKGKKTASSLLSRYGTTCELLTDDRGAESWIAYLEASRVRTSAPLERVKGSPDLVVDSGKNLQGSLTKWDRDTCSWKTPQLSLLAGWESFLETWPRWGSMRNGVCWERPTLGHPISENESGYWPTPCARDFRTGNREDSKRAMGVSQRHSKQLNDKVAPGGHLNPPGSSG